MTFSVGSMGLSPRSRDLDGFELAGEDGVYYPAKAIVLRGDEHIAKAIKVYRCPEAARPVAVRYAWSRWCPRRYVAACAAGAPRQTYMSGVVQQYRPSENHPKFRVTVPISIRINRFWVPSLIKSSKTLRDDSC